MPKGKHLSIEDRKRVFHYLALGLSDSATASACGISAKSVERMRQRQGAKANPDSTRAIRRAAEDARAIALLQDGAPYHEVARTMGKSSSTIIRRYPGYGWSKEDQREWSSWALKMREAIIKLDLRIGA